MRNVILEGNALDVLQQRASKSVNCCVTSPPYFGLRDYGHDGQIGLEETPEQYVAKLVDVFREVRRVLKDDGTLWLNLGDSYAGSGKGGNSESKRSKNWQPEYANHGQTYGLKQKDLIGIPWMVAFALRADGWYLRQDIIWSKPNPMPESVTDRCTKSHEYIFLFSKSKKYYFDHEAIKKPVASSSIDRLSQDVESQAGSSRVPGKTNGTMKAVSSWKGSSFDKGKTGEMQDYGRGYIRKSGNKARKPDSERGCPADSGSNVCGSVPWEGLTANKRDVWTVEDENNHNHFLQFLIQNVDPKIIGCQLL